MKNWNKPASILALGAIGIALWFANTGTIAKADDTDVALAWVTAWNSHNADSVAALFTPDATYEDVPLGVVSHGTAQIRAFAQAFFDAVPDSRIVYVSSSLKGGRGVIEWVFGGTDVGLYKTRKTFSVRGATVIDVHGTKISRNSDYYDLATMLREFGLLPSGL
jgi:steroid delta-isomerase-like uncharacterized protein